MAETVIRSTDTADESYRIDKILEASSKHDIVSLEKFLKEFTFSESEAVDVQNTSGTSPLHAAISSCAQESSPNTDGESKPNETETLACETIQTLLENGAIWNQLDQNDETPGCIAYRLELQDLYRIMVDAGVRAELLMNRLEGYEELDDEDEDEQDDQVEEGGEIDEPPTKKLKSGTAEVSEDDTEAPELITVDVQDDQEEAHTSTDVNSTDYLSSALSLTKDKLLDDQQNGVMMAWESDIMKRSADAILDQPELKVLNIGAGMLIFDSFIQSSENKPTSHHIVEAHPDVLANMEAKGWNEKPGVVIHAGRWQDILPDLVAENNTFDAIYFDTFAESYMDFKEFFSEQVIGLLSQEGKWSFFNGMGADRQISYDVYQKVVEMDLFEAGFDIEWQELDVPVLDEEWNGVKRKYWAVSKYRLPICKFMA